MWCEVVLPEVTSPEVNCQELEVTCLEACYAHAQPVPALFAKPFSPPDPSEITALTGTSVSIDNENA
jgi:hypothetical protein